MRRNNLIDMITEAVIEQITEKKGQKQSTKDKENKTNAKNEKDVNSSAYLTKQRKVDKILNDPTVNCAALYRKAFPEDYRSGDENSQRGYKNKKKNKAKGPNGKSYRWTMDELSAIIKAYNKSKKV